MIDSHCHLTYEQLHGQLEAVLARAAEAGVSRIITIGTSVADAEKAIALCRRHTDVRCAVGIHPHHAGEVGEADFEALRRLEREPEVLALGEMGLDYHYDFAPRAAQHRVFREQLAHAKEKGRPVVIHCREAVEDCLAIFSEFPGVPALFHCFTGTKEEARKILERGYLLGFTGVLTYKKSDELREVARFVPADQMVVETDAPYLSPEPVRKHKNNEPAFVVHTAAVLAKVRGISVEEVNRVTTENVVKFFGWS